MKLKLFGWELEFRKESDVERLERVIRERKVKEATEALLSLADLRRHDQGTAAAIGRAMAKGSLYPCPKCGHEKWRDNLCFGCEVVPDKGGDR